MKNLGATILLIAASASAWPVDVYVEARVGEEKFQKAAGTEWVDVQKPEVALVEALPGDEVLITGKQDGRTLVLLYGEGRMGVWSIRTEASQKVDTAALFSAATAACPGLKRNPSSKTDALVVHVATEKCRLALRELLKADVHDSRDITLTFEIAMLQSQLRDIQTAIDAAVGQRKVDTAYAGASLRLKGAITQAEHRKALWAIFNSAVGRVSLDDRLVLTDKPAADAGIAKLP